MPRRERKFETDEEKQVRAQEARDKHLQTWVPKTAVGKMVQNGEISSMDDFFSKGMRVMEPEIVDILLPGMTDKMVELRKTARITRQGRSFSFRAAVLIGDGDSYIGIGTAKDRERFPALTKAMNNAKLSIIKVRKGCGSWECRCKEHHSVPFKAEGNSSSVRVILLPAPKGTGLVVGEKIKDVLKFVGIKDVWSKTRGNTGSTLDFVCAAVNALAATNDVKYSEDMAKKLEERK
ncbi:MAG TPA: 30S ribosomal protein S5 [archaeon]|nr:30S ribosomal protein S5 [archaeon]